jgi:hypothetical protein
MYLDRQNYVKDTKSNQEINIKPERHEIIDNQILIIKNNYKNNVMSTLRAASTIPVSTLP